MHIKRTRFSRKNRGENQARRKERKEEKYVLRFQGNIPSETLQEE